MQDLAKPRSAERPAPAIGFAALLAYGFFGLPLAMVALPIYVYVPQFYASHSGLSLATIGFALLAARVLAAFLDPLLGRWIERGNGAYARFVLGALPLLLAGFIALFHPPALGTLASLAWFLASLGLVYTGFGLAMIAHQSWGAALTQAPSQRSRVSAAREACGLLGVMAAAGLTASLGYDGLSLAFALFLLGGAALLLRSAPRPTPRTAQRQESAGLVLPFRGAPFRALFAVLLVNGVASAVPATLFLFFAEDKLRLGPSAGLFLILYFAAAAISVPLWVRLAQRYGEARAWAGGMLMSALVFVWAYGLGAGAVVGFGVICLLSGLALGADLVLPAALLAGVIRRAGHSGQREAAYFGIWNWGVQISLALAAGIALPLLGWLGYMPGPGADTVALSAAYALLPCALKLVALFMLWRAPLRDC